MKVLCVIDSLTSGGAQRQLVNLAISFKLRGHDVSFLVYHRINFFNKILENHNIPINEIIEPNYLKRLIKMRRFIRLGNFDGVLSFLESSNLICTISGFPKRKWTLVVGERSANPKIYSSLKKRIFRFFHIYADFVVSNSHENIKIVKKINPFLNPAKCKVIYNILDFRNLETTTNKLGNTDESLTLLVGASHRHLKNLNGLIEAINKLMPNEKKRIRIHWFGDNSIDDSKTKAEFKIKEYGLSSNFFFHEPTENIYDEMRNSDAVGLFSLHEGLPNVICEAMILGKPVISSAVSDVPLLLKNTRLTFNPNSNSEISQSISYLLKMSKEELIQEGEQNRIHALKIFDNNKNIDRYLGLLQKNKSNKFQ